MLSRRWGGILPEHGLPMGFPARPCWLAPCPSHKHSFLSLGLGSSWPMRSGCGEFRGLSPVSWLPVIMAPDDSGSVAAGLGSDPGPRQGKARLRAPTVLRTPRVGWLCTGAEG